MFVQVPVEITIGSEVFALLPAKKDKKGVPRVDIILGTVEFINDKDVDNRVLTISALFDDGSFNTVTKYFKVGEYRVTDYTFGGVLMKNPKFDQKRIEKEDNVRLGGMAII